MQALWQIIVVDVSMSLDNLLAVAAVARDNPAMLIIGLTVSIVLMGMLGGALAKLLDRYKAIACVGLVLIAYVGLLWEGAVATNQALAPGLPLPQAH